VKINPATTGGVTEMCPQVPGRLWCLSEGMPAPTTGATANSPNPPVPGLKPTDLTKAYSIPSTTRTTTVAIVDAYHNPTTYHDMTLYRSQFGLPACTTQSGCFREVNQHGQAGPLPARAGSDWAFEETLDVEMVSATCPSCHIVLIETDDDDRSGKPDLEYGVHTAAKLGYKYVSMSWGGSEYPQERSVDSTYLGYAGVTYVAAAGDFDRGTSWPAVNPNVVSVGGTTLVPSSAARGFSETVWGETAQGGTGSGCSAYEPRPYWQSSISPSVCSHRAMNDVSVTASVQHGVSVYWSYLGGAPWYLGGGTSAGSPIITAMYAIKGGTNGANPASYLYAHPTAFWDVTSGRNGNCPSAPALCTAGRGWDGPTGLGTPKGLNGFAPPARTKILAIHNPGPQQTWNGSGVAIRAVGQDSDRRVPLRYSATGLPPGAYIGTDGNIRGRPSSPGSRVVTVTVRDANGASAKMAFRWTVIDHHIAASSTPKITGTVARGHTVTATYTSWRYDKPTGSLSHPTVHFQWYFDGRPIGAANKKTLTLSTSTSWYHHRLSLKITATQTYCIGYTYTTPYTAPIA
jgi:hypothetical protein